MSEQSREGLHTWSQTRVSRLHLATEAGYKMHGRMQSVLVHQVTIVSNEGQHTVETSCLKHCPSLPGADKLQDLQKPLYNNALGNQASHTLSVTIMAIELLKQKISKIKEEKVHCMY